MTAPVSPPVVRLVHRTEKDEDGWPVLATILPATPTVVYLASSSELTSPLAVARAKRKAYKSAEHILTEWEPDDP